MKRILVLTEGQTEERFVKDVLQPHLWSFNVHIEPAILVTKRINSGPSFKGGITSYSRLRRDLRLLLADTNAAMVTTLVDLYGLPPDMPDSAQALGLKGTKLAAFLESAIRRDLNEPRLRPFLMVHEYETLLYCDCRVTATELAKPELETKLAAERSLVGSPEEINDGAATHPASRILKLFPNYQKRLYGPSIASKIGLEAIRRQCPHFTEWLCTLEEA